MSEKDALDASKNKALEVENYFIENGIDKNILFVESRGSKDPLYAANNQSDDISTRVMVSMYVNFPRDLDGDGVDIDKDECPNTIKGHKVGPNGCKLKTMVVLLAGKKETSSVIVGTKAGNVVIDTPNQLVSILSDNTPPSKPQNVSKEDLDSLMDNTIEASNKEELSYVLYFNGLNLVDESLQKVQELLENIAKRENGYITIIGHTDTVGSKERNDIVSAKRAQVIKNLILEAKVPYLKIDTQAYAESNLAVPTNDEVEEPLNKRVEIFIN
jgi:outer membrane protein OmpA-like peptidoglycan-associated protein